MDYDFHRLNTRDFEHLIQSLCKKLIGNSSITFGDGPDGGREATYTGSAPFPSDSDNWDGYWVAQAKFKQRNEHDDNFLWVKKHFESEMKKFENQKSQGIKLPDNYLFFTNAILTPVLKNGGRDKIEKLKEKYTQKLIPNIFIFGYDDLCRMLDANRDIATSYASYILPGDILNELYQFIKQKNQAEIDHSKLLLRFLEHEFRDDMFSRLEQGGKLTDEKVNLEKVFIDLYATKDGLIPEKKSVPRFIQSCILKGDQTLKPYFDNQEPSLNRYVLIAGAGYGKSTLTQFLCQTYRAYFLKSTANNIMMDSVDKFIDDYSYLNINQPTCHRFPFRIILKDYAGWIITQKAENQSFSVLKYFQYKLEKKGEGKIELDDIRILLSKLSFLFVFDGLDEVPATSNRKEIMEEINNFIDIELKNEKCDALIIATSRPQGYTREFDSTKSKHLYIANLNKEDCLVYLNKLMQRIDDSVEQREKYIKIIMTALEDEVVARLMETPLQATIMAILVKSGGEPPRVRFNLFTEFYEIMLRRERQKGIVKVISEHPNYIDAIHYKLGFMLQKLSEDNNNPSSNINNKEFEEFIREYLTDEIALDKDEVDTYVSEILEAIKHRLVFITDTEEGKVGFTIRSTQEYFAANYLMHNQRDEEIPNNLKKISQSIYWRNTFLFAIGYLNQYKDYLIDVVESICSELNGSSEDFNSQNGKTISKIGSWLALDILNEGVFRGKPKFENKFARYLESLFLLAPSESHLYFGKLPKKLVEKWVLNFIEKYINEGNSIQKLTTLTIAINLEKHGHGDMSKYFSKLNIKKSEESEVLKYVCKNNYFNNVIIDKLAKNLSNDKDLTYSNILNNRELLTKIKESKFYCDSVESNILQNLFFEDFRSLSLSQLSFFLNIDDNIKLLARKEIEIKLSKGVPLHYTSIFNQETLLTKKLKEQAKILNINYMTNFLEFITEPNIKHLTNFLTSLKEEPDFIFEAFKYRTPNINWLINKIFKLYPEKHLLDKAITCVMQGVLGDTEDWKDFEYRLIKNQMEAVDIWKGTLELQVKFSSIDEEFLDYFFSLYLQLKPTITDKNELRMLYKQLIELSYLFNEIMHKEPSLDKKYENEVLTALKNLDLKDDLDNFYIKESWINIVNRLPTQEILTLAQHEQINSLNFNPFGIIFMFEKSLVSLESSFKKLAKVLFTFQLKSPLIRVLTYIVVLMHKLERKLLNEIDFNYLQTVKFEDSYDEICRVLLSLLDEDYKLEDAFNSLDNIYNLNQMIVQYAAPWINDFVKNRTVKEKLLVHLYKFLTKDINNYKLLGLYEDMLRQVCETIPLSTE
ncbi:hypothetical protein P4S95_09215 [Aneurinibacillus aneurinilyticus]|uniref:NACHT domain-containing protein n=1 Tax=Aneurinibacillus aneurinilyticus TaxID=1391 RepID=UPI002E2261AE|nr:hypothetical protein [Aneurinibacillus aneurinilyticus]